MSQVQLITLLKIMDNYPIFPNSLAQLEEMNKSQSKSLSKRMTQSTQGSMKRF